MFAVHCWRYYFSDVLHGTQNTQRTEVSGDTQDSGDTDRCVTGEPTGEHRSHDSRVMCKPLVSQSRAVVRSNLSFLTFSVSVKRIRYHSRLYTIIWAKGHGARAYTLAIVRSDRCPHTTSQARHWILLVYSTGQHAQVRVMA